MDGFMDTMDAFHSYQSKEKKLEILKDAHIGAFAVIMLVTYGLIYMGAFSEITDPEVLRIVAAGFFLSRALSGISVVTFPSVKKDGMLHFFADSSHKKCVKVFLCVQAVMCILFMFYQEIVPGIAIVLTAFGTYGYYYYRTRKELGGITGDTAGYFVVICEGCMMVVAAVSCCLI